MSKLIVPQWPQPKGVAACSSTRIGGVSLPPYDSLNLGAHCGDNPDHVEENRKRLFAAGNLPSKPVWLEQVHGKDVLKLTGEPYASKRADASYSNTPGTVCAVMTADCLPVLFCNRAGTEVAAAHAGWRGLCAGVLEETVSCFADNPENILAWLGPAIGPRAFEVGVPAGQTSGDSLSHHGTLPCAHASAVASGNWTYAPDPRAYGPYHSSAGGRSGLWWPSASAKRCFGSIYLHAA